MKQIEKKGNVKYNTHPKDFFAGSYTDKEIRERDSNVTATVSASDPRSSRNLRLQLLSRRYLRGSAESARC